jgi:hypothetical protein
MKEIANKMIVCNIHRFLQFLIIEVFYRAKIFVALLAWSWAGDYLVLYRIH